MAQKHLESVESLARIVEDVQTPFIGVEVGVHEGWLTRYLLKKMPNLTLHGVDPWKARVSTQCGRQKVHNASRKIAMDRTKEFGERCVIHHMMSHEVEDFGPIAFVFIDGDHTAAAVYLDLTLWWPRLVPGGMCMCHDYASGVFRGPKDSFQSFAKRQGLSEPQCMPGSVGWLRKPDDVVV